MEPAQEASSPRPWPPIIYATAACVAGLLSWLIGWPFEPSDLRFVTQGLGVLLGGLGIVSVVLAGRRFNAAGTPIPPNRPTKALVFEGVYRYTRNPMYLGFTLLLVGLGILFDSAWFVIAAPFAMLAVTKLAIEREEAYLERKFGAPYVAYKSRVRRWL